MNPHNKIYSENERDMLDNEGNIIDKKDRKSYIVDAAETIVINNNIQNTNLHNSDLLVKNTEEHA